jgi:hypothetical protein
MDQFHKTRMGQKFYTADVPRIADALERIAVALENVTPEARDAKVEREMVAFLKKFAPKMMAKSAGLEELSPDDISPGPGKLNETGLAELKGLMSQRLHGVPLCELPLDHPDRLTPIKCHGSTDKHPTPAPQEGDANG